MDNVQEAFAVLKQAMVDDGAGEQGSYAHSWHCNIAMMCHDAIQEEAEARDCFVLDAHSIGNDAASRFMKLCFDIETKA